MDTATVRRFARVTTARLGVLDEFWQQPGRPLGQSRLLWELRDGPTRLGRLRARLGLDSGYATRLVRALADEGLVTVREDEDDGRARVVALTAAGRAEVEELDRRSDAFAAGLAPGLDPARRARLVDAMDTVARLLDAGAVTIADADPTSAEVRGAHDAYFAELARRFPAGFDPGDTSAELTRYRPPDGACVVARLDGDVVGTAALAPLAPRDAADDAPRPLGEVKRMWVADRVRGLGVGRRLLDALHDRAAAAGVATLRLDTNEVLTSALGLYAAAGYVEVPRYNDNPHATHFLERAVR